MNARAASSQALLAAQSRAVSYAANYYARRSQWVDRRDLEQVAWVAVLDCSQRHPGVVATPLFIGAAIQAVRAWLNKTWAPVSGAHDVVAKATKRASVADITRAADAAGQDDGRPAHVQDSEAQLICAQWLDGVDVVLRELVTQDPDIAPGIAVLQGMEHRDALEAFGLDRGALAKSKRKAAAKIKASGALRRSWSGR